MIFSTKPATARKDWVVVATSAGAAYAQDCPAPVDFIDFADTATLSERHFYRLPIGTAHEVQSAIKEGSMDVPTGYATISGSWEKRSVDRR